MKSLYSHLLKQNIVYITRDIERALGIHPQNGYYVITNKTPYAESILKHYEKNVRLFDSQSHELMDTQELLNIEEVKEIINETKPFLLVFKNSTLIEKKCRENGWNLLNPNATLSEKIENKISQIEWLGELTSHLPPHEITDCKNLTWEDTPYIIQFNRSHTGEGTILIDSEQKLLEIQDQFPSRQVKKTKYINGPVFTSNIVVAKDTILFGNISFQITGIHPFTNYPFSTIGNDWGLPKKILSRTQTHSYTTIATSVAQKLQHEGWKGLFGIDIKIDETTGEVYLIEINARQCASVTYESELQEKVRQKTKSNEITAMEAHIAALLNIPIEEELISIASGSQIIQRVTPAYTDTLKKLETEALANLGLKVIPYTNTKVNSDLLRIQSEESMMADTKTLNNLGKTVATILSA